MRNNPPPLNLSHPALLDQPQQRMKRAPRLERANPLEILTLEEEPEFRTRGCLAFEGGVEEGLGGLGSAGEGVEGGDGMVRMLRV